MRKHYKDDPLTLVKYPEEPRWERQLWAVAENYVIKNGILFPQGEMRSSYAPLRTVELPAELQRIATGELSPLDFSRQFGLLGYGPLIRDYGKDTGEPVPWILAHARTVRFCLHCIGLLEESAHEQQIRHELEQFPNGPYAHRDKLVQIPLRDELSRPELEADVVARMRIGFLITENICRMRRRLQLDFRATRLESSIHFDAMIETVYWTLANRIEGGGVKRCLGCHQFFVSRDKRQQYCPPFPGSTRSRCSSRLNVQIFRSRQ